MNLEEILSLDEVTEDRWRARTPPDTGRRDIFGGQVAAQALRAAGLTVGADHLPNSVHCYFLRAGNPDLPLDITVERVRAGRTYSSRRVEVSQNDRPVLTMLASFHAAEPGRDYDLSMPAGLPDPEDLDDAENGRSWEGAVRVRMVEGEAPVVRWWGQAVTPLTDDPFLHCSALLYASDMRAAGSAMAAVGFGFMGSGDRQGLQPVGRFGSLDHALWFHRVPVVNDWFFTEVRPLTVRDSRGLVLGTMFDRAGNHLATFTQEVFLKEGEAESGAG